MDELPAIGYHVRPTDESQPDGVYRIVGLGDEVTLLRVGEAEGRRVHTGEIRHVPAETVETAFEAAPNPDAGFTPIRAVRNACDGLYWQVRKYL